MTKKEKMYSLVKQWRTTNMARKAFAEQHGITDSSFEYWCRKQSHDIIQPVTKPDFIELASKSIIDKKPPSPRIELELCDGLRIKIY